jgi:hypothetical protein
VLNTNLNTRYLHFILLQDGFAPPEEVDGDVPPPNEEEEY